MEEDFLDNATKLSLDFDPVPTLMDQANDIISTQRKESRVAQLPTPQKVINETKKALEEVSKRHRNETKYHPAFCNMLIDHMSAGYSFSAFAGIVRATRQCLYLWVDRHEDFAHAKKIGEERCLLFWEKAGREGMINGKGFNTPVWIFSMKNRFNWRDVGYQEKAPEQQAQVNLSADQLIELVKAARADQAKAAPNMQQIRDITPTPALSKASDETDAERATMANGGNSAVVPKK